MWSLDGAPRGSLVPTKKWQRRVMVWGAVGLQGQHRFYIVPSGADGTVDASVYLNVILRGVLPLLDENPGTMFQQDNARSHIAAGPIRILRATGSLLEPWPANSPDMSPVEFVWARMLGILNLVNNWDTRKPRRCPLRSVCTRCHRSVVPHSYLGTSSLQYGVYSGSCGRAELNGFPPLIYQS